MTKSGKNTASAMETDAVNLEDYKCLVLQDALVEGHNVVACHLTSSLTKYVFYNWLINNILYLCVT